MSYTRIQLQTLLGAECYSRYERLNNYISDHYNVDQIWDKGGKDWDTCLRYSRSGKTLCTAFFRQRQFGIMIILGKEERRKFEEMSARFSEEVRTKYASTHTYHDGKWLLFDVENDSLFSDIVMLLSIKRTPGRKLTMCGYCCDICRAFAGNIRKKDERAALSGYWKDYFGLDIPVDEMHCDGCRCKKADAHLLDDSCPVRACVLDKKLNDCSECASYPCDTFLTRKGYSHEEVDAIKELDIFNYYTYLCAFDNQSRLDRKEKK